jgi:hypothetical protein
MGRRCLRVRFLNQVVDSYKSTQCAVQISMCVMLHSRSDQFADTEISVMYLSDADREMQMIYARARVGRGSADLARNVIR